MKIVMLPWLAHGHVSPFLELAKRLAKRNNFQIYLYSSPVILSSFKNKITTGEYSGSIEYVELKLPSLPDLPPHYHTTNGLPPHLMPTLKRAFEMSAPHISNTFTTLHPDLFIYDFNGISAAEIASSLNIPVVQFLTVGASVLGFGLYMLKHPGEQFPFPEIYLRDYEIAKVRSGDDKVNDVSDGDRFLRGFNLCKILLIKTCKEIEGKFIDFLSVASGKKVVPVGLLVHELNLENDIQEEEAEILSWLDQKEKGSVVFVSFGSEYFLTGEERREIARGLELINVNFIWVIRFPQEEKKTTTIEEALPKGFIERVGERGKIVEKWAPQARILKHENTGAFLSHCGWSSMMESMKFGVPMIAVPMHIDQPLNARLVEAVGVGLEAVRDEQGNLQSEEIGKVIRKVLVEESGEHVRRKAKELSEELEMRGEEAEIDNLVKELQQLQ